MAEVVEVQGPARPSGLRPWVGARHTVRRAGGGQTPVTAKTWNRVGAHPSRLCAERR